MTSDEYTKQFPRLTGTIRAFSRVSPRYEELSENAERNIIKKRREAEKSRGDASTSAVKSIPIASSSSSGVDLSWSNLVDRLVPDRNNQKSSKLKSMLDTLRLQMVKQLLNEDFNDSTLLNEAALFVVETFYDRRCVSASASASASNFEALDKVSKKLKDRFGQFQRNLFDQLRDLMEKLFSEIDLLNKMIVLDDFFKPAKISDLNQTNQTNVIKCNF